MCSSKSICAVLKPQMGSYQANIVFYRFPVDAPENAKNVVIEHQKYKMFWRRTPRPSYFIYKTLTC